MISTTTRDAPAAQSSPLGGLPPSWHQRAVLLETYTVHAAEARQAAVLVYAQAWMAAEGTGEYRTQAAKRESAAYQLDADRAKARLDAYKLMVDAELAGL